jgi:hypothetical protein
MVRIGRVPFLAAGVAPVRERHDARQRSFSARRDVDGSVLVVVVFMVSWKDRRVNEPRCAALGDDPLGEFIPGAFVHTEAAFGDDLDERVDEAVRPASVPGTSMIGKNENVTGRIASTPVRSTFCQARRCARVRSPSSTATSAGRARLGSRTSRGCGLITATTRGSCAAQRRTIAAVATSVKSYCSRRVSAGRGIRRAPRGWRPRHAGS